MKVTRLLLVAGRTAFIASCWAIVIGACIYFSKYEEFLLPREKSKRADGGRLGLLPGQPARRANTMPGNSPVIPSQATSKPSWQTDFSTIDLFEGPSSGSENHPETTSEYETRLEATLKAGSGR